MSSAKIIAIGVFVGIGTLFLLMGVLLCVHEAILVRSGQGESIAAVLGIIFLCPVSVAMCAVSILKIYHTPEPLRPDDGSDDIH